MKKHIALCLAAAALTASSAFAAEPTELKCKSWENIFNGEGREIRSAGFNDTAPLKVSELGDRRAKLLFPLGGQLITVQGVYEIGYTLISIEKKKPDGSDKVSSLYSSRGQMKWFINRDVFDIDCRLE